MCTIVHKLSDSLWWWRAILSACMKRERKCIRYRMWHDNDKNDKFGANKTREQINAHSLYKTNELIAIVVCERGSYTILLNIIQDLWQFTVTVDGRWIQKKTWKPVCVCAYVMHACEHFTKCRKTVFVSREECDYLQISLSFSHLFLHLYGSIESRALGRQQRHRFRYFIRKMLISTLL